MRAGKLRHRASLQRRQVTQDTFGAEIATWEEFAAVAAGVEPLQGREFLAALGQGEQGEITTRIRIRYRGDVRTADRVVVGRGATARTFDVEAVLTDERQRGEELMCRELVE